MKASLARCRSHPDELERTENMKLIRSGTAKSASFICIALLALLVGCKGPTKLKHFPVSGEVMAKSVSSQEITLRHGDVPGFMAAMTMDYSLPNAAVLDELQPGDRIAAQIAMWSSRQRWPAKEPPARNPPHELATGEAIPDVPLGVYVR
jgi:Cu/Ag efflux protein CusF